MAPKGGKYKLTTYNKKRTDAAERKQKSRALQRAAAPPNANNAENSASEESSSSDEESTKAGKVSMPCRLAMFDFNQCDQECTAHKLQGLGILSTLERTAKFPGLILSSTGTATLSMADKALILSSGLAVVDCSWDKYEILRPSTVKATEHRLLPYLIAANPVNSGCPRKLTCAEALAAALYIIDEIDSAVALMGKFTWGQNFLDKNSEALELYRKCKDSEEIMQKEGEYIEKIGREERMKPVNLPEMSLSAEDEESDEVFVSSQGAGMLSVDSSSSSSASPPAQCITSSLSISPDESPHIDAARKTMMFEVASPRQNQALGKTVIPDVAPQREQHRMGQQRKVSVGRHYANQAYDPDEGEDQVPVAREMGTNTNLYIGGLPHYYTQNELVTLFKPYGKIYSSKVLTDRASGACLGVGFVRYYQKEDADKAITALNGPDPDGTNSNQLQVKYATIASQEIEELKQDYECQIRHLKKEIRLLKSSEQQKLFKLEAECAELNDAVAGKNSELKALETRLESEIKALKEDYESRIRHLNQKICELERARYEEQEEDDLTTSLGDVTTQEDLGEGQEEWMQFVKERRKITAAKLKTLLDGSVTEIDFSEFDLELEPEDYNMLARAPNLVHINFDNVKLSDEAIKKMSNQMKNRVKCLSLKGSLTENVASYTLPFLLEQCQSLEYLNVCKIGRDVQKKAEPNFDPSSLKLPKNLKYVQLDHTINYDKFINFARRHCPNLEVIQYVNDHGLPVTRKLMNSIVKLKNLKYLHLDLSSLKELAEFVPTLKSLGGLKGLLLKKVDNQIITEIAANCRQLEHLTLTRDGSLGESLREGLLKVCTLPKLRSISLQYQTSAENVRPEKTEVYVHMFEGLNQTGVLECIQIVDPVLIPIEVVCQALKACPNLNTIYAYIHPKDAYQILFDTMNEIRGSETAPSSENDPGIVYIKEWSPPGESRHKWVRFFDEESPVGRVAHEIRMSSLSEKPKFLNNIPLILDESHPVT